MNKKVWIAIGIGVVILGGAAVWYFTSKGKSPKQKSKDQEDMDTALRSIDPEIDKPVKLTPTSSGILGGAIARQNIRARRILGVEKKGITKDVLTFSSLPKSASSIPPSSTQAMRSHSILPVSRVRVGNSLF